jgi:hypothetical protein
MGRPCQLACAGGVSANAVGAMTSIATKSVAAANGPTMRHAHVRESIQVS